MNHLSLVKNPSRRFHAIRVNAYTYSILWPEERTRCFPVIEKARQFFQGAITAILVGGVFTHSSVENFKGQDFCNNFYIKPSPTRMLKSWDLRVVA